MTILKEELDLFLKENINKTLTKALNAINKNYKEKNVNVLNFEAKANDNNSIKKTFLKSFHNEGIRDENLDEYFKKMLKALQGEIKNKKEESLRRRASRSDDYSEIKKPREKNREGFNDIIGEYNNKKFHASVKSVSPASKIFTDFEKNIPNPSEDNVKKVFNNLITKREFLILNQGSDVSVYQYNPNKMGNLIIKKSGSRNFVAQNKNGVNIFTIQGRTGNSYQFKMYYKTAKKNNYIVLLKKEEQKRIKKALNYK